MPTTTSLLPDADPALWRGAVDWERRSDGAHRAWRMLPAQAERAHAPELVRHATMAAGVRLEAITAAASLRVDLELEHDGPAVLDVVVDGGLLERHPLEPGPFSATIALPAGEHHVELWLPQVGQTWLRTVGATGAGATAAVAAPRPATRWVTYGSSITHCSAAAGPSRTWPAIVARTLGWDLTCLGLGGQCHLDPAMARTIAALPADVVSLCLGINVQGGATFAERTFPGQVSAFVEQVRAAHPDATIVVMTPITSPPREDAPNVVGLTLEAVRASLHRVVEVLARDDERLFLVDGPTIIGPADQHLLPDDLHPDAEGYELMGARLAPVLGELRAGATA